MYELLLLLHKSKSLYFGRLKISKVRHRFILKREINLFDKYARKLAWIMIDIKSKVINYARR